MKYILGEFVDNVFNLDSKFFTSIKYLVFKPGFLSQEYAAGRRKSYVAPIRLYIVMSVVLFFMISVIDFTGDATHNFNLTFNGENSEVDTTAAVDGVVFPSDTGNYILTTTDLKKLEYQGKLDHYLDSVTYNKGFAGYLSKKLAKSKVNDEGFSDILLDQFSLFLLLFLPLFSLMYATILSGSKKGFINHLIFNIHVNSFVMLVLLVHMLIDLVLPSGILTILWAVAMLLGSQVYLIKAVMKFYDRKWWVALYKYLFLLLGYIVLAVLFIVFVFVSSILVF